MQRTLLGCLGLLVAGAVGAVQPTNGVPSNGVPSNGVPSNGVPSNGVPSNGVPSNGVPSNGINLTALESTLLFGNPAVHKALMTRPLSAAGVTDTTSDFWQVWLDPYSALVLSYIWADVMPPGRNLTYCPAEAKLDVCSDPLNSTFYFFGNLGLCSYPGNPVGFQGWANDQSLESDTGCQVVLSGVFLSQNNQFPIHNLYSANGPWDQLRAAAAAVLGFQYKFGTHDLVEAIGNKCDSTTGTEGPVNCSQSSAWDGTCSPGDLIGVTLKTPASAGLFMMVNQGIHARNFPNTQYGACFGAGTSCKDENVLGWSALAPGQLSPYVQFRCPLSATFNIQWAPWKRADASLIGGDTQFLAQVVPDPANSTAAYVLYPADELDVFPRSNREGLFAGNVFSSSTSAPAMSPDFTKCETRAAPNMCDGSLVAFASAVCDPAISACCAPCDRSNLDVISKVAATPSVVANIGNGANPGGSYSAFQNTLSEDVYVTGAKVNVGVLSAASVQVVGAMDGFLSGGLVPIHATVPNTADVRGSGFLFTNLDFVGLPCVYGTCNEQVLFSPPILVHPQETLFVGIVAGGPGPLDAQIYGDGTTAPTSQPAPGWTYPVWTGALLNFSGTWFANYTQDIVVTGVAVSKPVVVFPDAHVWLASTWDAKKDYFKNRACSSDHLTCIANYEGVVEMQCRELLDTDSTSPLPYSGAARRLYDVGQCKLADGTGPYSKPGVTTFFANYGAGVDGPVDASCSFDRPPVASAAAGSTTVCGGSKVTLDASGTYDPDADFLVYRWQGSNGAVLSGRQATYTAPNPDPGGTVVTFTVTASDDCSLSSTSSPINISVKHTNQAPVAEIQGGDQAVNEGSPVTLDGSKSYDPDGPQDLLGASWSWTQDFSAGHASDPVVTLTNPTGKVAGFTAPTLSGGGGASPTLTLRFALEVTDAPSVDGDFCGGPLTSDKQYVNVTVQRLNDPPIAKPGDPQTKDELTSVTLNGTGSYDPDKDLIVAYSWRQTQGTAVTLDDPHSPTPTFIAPDEPPSAKETLKFALSVQDQWGAWSTEAETEVTVLDVFSPPDCSHGVATVGTLWPPDHRMVQIGVTGVKDLDTDASHEIITIDRVFQNEPTSGLGAGDTPVDAKIVGDGTALIRAERSGSGAGRFYYISYTAAAYTPTNVFAGSCSGVVKVCVPQSMSSKNPGCVDGAGPAYDSTK